MTNNFSTNEKFHPVKFAIVFAVIMLIAFFIKQAGAQQPINTSSAFNAATATKSVATKTVANWTTSYDDAVEQSKRTKVPIMLYFTGSDWCPWCKRLSDEVFDTQDFAAWSKGRVILVVVDFPRQSQLPPELANKNHQLQAKFGNHLKSYPTALFLNPEEEVIGSLGYQPDGKHAWMNRAQKFIAKNDQLTNIQPVFDFLIAAL